MQVWANVERALSAHPACALITVVEVRGSAPREAGARMVVMPDGGFLGTIGGGALEWQAIAQARENLARHEPLTRLSRHALGPELGQCCGGSVRLLTEVFDRGRVDEVRLLAKAELDGPFLTRAELSEKRIHREPAADISGEGEAPLRLDGRVLTEQFGARRRNVALFGAGHVGRALMLALAPLPFDVTWIDGRADAFPAALPANVHTRATRDAAAEVATLSDRALVVVMTHSHPLDLAIVHSALVAGRFDYVGLIGSKSKRARFSHRLREAGVDDESIAELVCPIGVGGIRSKLPAAIAAAVAAELLQREETLAPPTLAVEGRVATGTGAGDRQPYTQGRTLAAGSHGPGSVSAPLSSVGQPSTEVIEGGGQVG